jgi:predicted metal-binding membrane protein
MNPPDRPAGAAAPAGSIVLDPQSLRLALVAALSVLAWIVLAAWSASPYARYLEHGGWADQGLFGELCRSFPQGTVIVPALTHAFAWLLMIVAMMLPTTLPLLSIVGRIVAGRRDAGSLLARVVVGYAIAWLGFGLLAHGLDSLLHLAAAQAGWLAGRGWAIGAVVLAGAGAFQFSALKYRCLERCRTPFAFVNARWHGRKPRREALRIGFDHGIFCVGCCWALMAVMFVAGMGNLGWMLVLAAAMAAEKNLAWGRKLRTPLGLGLIAWSGLLVVTNV